MSPTVESLLKIPSKFTTSKVRILLVCFDAKAYRCEVKLFCLLTNPFHTSKRTIQITPAPLTIYALFLT